MPPAGGRAPGGVEGFTEDRRPGARTDAREDRRRRVRPRIRRWPRRHRHRPSVPVHPSPEQESPVLAIRNVLLLAWVVSSAGLKGNRRRRRGGRKDRDLAATPVSSVPGVSAAFGPGSGASKASPQRLRSGEASRIPRRRGSPCGEPSVMPDGPASARTRGPGGVPGHGRPVRGERHPHPPARVAGRRCQGAGCPCALPHAP